MIPANIRKKMGHTHGAKPSHQKEIGHVGKGAMHK